MSLPITLFSALFADEIVRVVLGPNWAGAAILFRLLAPTILIFGMINPWPGCCTPLASRAAA
jgi:PST family polysaccharide transporter